MWLSWPQVGPHRNWPVSAGSVALVRPGRVQSKGHWLKGQHFKRETGDRQGRRTGRPWLAG